MAPFRKRYFFWINDTEAAGLKVVKDEEGISESEQIRQAIRGWLRRKGVKRRGPKWPRTRPPRRRATG